MNGQLMCSRYGGTQSPGDRVVSTIVAVTAVQDQYFKNEEIYLIFIVKLVQFRHLQ